MPDVEPDSSPKGTLVSEAQPHVPSTRAMTGHPRELSALGLVRFRVEGASGPPKLEPGPGKVPTMPVFTTMNLT